METSLHRQLKEHYATPGARFEVRLGRFRIDIVSGDRLIEVQHSSLAAIRSKTLSLLNDHHVEIIKPIVARKRLVKLTRKDGSVCSRRWSPKRCTPLDLFHELVYFTNVFPHPKLTLRIPLVEIEELRYPFRRRWFRGQFKVQDQRLTQVLEESVYRNRSDVCALLPSQLKQPFDTRQLASALGIERWVAQKIAYCLRKTGCIRQVGKQGNALQYRLTRGSTARSRQATRKTRAA